MTDFDLCHAWDAAISRLQSDDCPDGFINLHNEGRITRLEVMDNICKHCVDNDALATVVQRMRTHPEDWVRKIGIDIYEMIVRRANRVTDIAQIANTSPLQPGCRIRLNGSYDLTQWWLNGNDYYDATFVRFAERKHGEMPVAIIEFDNEIDMTESCGQIHRGKFGVMKLHFVADWDSSETVCVHIIASAPNNLDEFYDSHPFGTEIESHATYASLAGNGT